MIFRLLMTVCVACIFSVSGLCQYNYISEDNNSYTPGDWHDAATWTIPNGPSPLPTPSENYNPEVTHSQLGNVSIYGYTFVDRNLNSINASPHIQVYDTLYIDGNSIFGSSANLTVHTNGLLIINGNVRQEGAFTFNNNGTVVVTGDVLVTNGSLNNNNDFYVYGDTDVTNGGGLNGCYPWQACDPESFTKTENNLIDENLPLYEFVASKSLNVPLPVTLLHFQAQPQSSTDVLLSWATAEEENFDYFTVERSHNGVDFAEVGRVYGSGVNTKERRDYELIDTNPLSGTSYYRLKAIDYDGTVEYFKPTYVNIEQQGFSANIYPNPGSGEQLTLQVATHNPEAAGFEIYNLQGVLVHQQQVRFPTNTITFSKHLEKGMYVAVIRAGSESKTLKWMVE